MSLALGAKSTMFAGEGSYFVATNPTVGTGIAGHAAPVVADTSTKALLHLFNSGKKTIFPDYLKLRWTAIGAAGTSTFWPVYVDNKGATARTSGGTSITPVNTRSDVGDVSGAVLFFGPVVTALDAASVRKVAAFQARSVIQVVEDTIVLAFGAPNAGGVTGGVTNAGTAVAPGYAALPPVAIGPGGNLVIAQITIAQSAASSFDFEFGFIER